MSSVRQASGWDCGARPAPPGGHPDRVRRRGQSPGSALRSHPRPSDGACRTRWSDVLGVLGRSRARRSWRPRRKAGNDALVPGRGTRPSFPEGAGRAGPHPRAGRTRVDVGRHQCGHRSLAGDHRRRPRRSAGEAGRAADGRLLSPAGRPVAVLGAGRGGRRCEQVLAAGGVDARQSRGAVDGGAAFDGGGHEPRNFARAFRSAVGMSPAQAIRKLRLESARERIETSDEPIEGIAVRAGFNDPERMRRAFIHAVGQPPQALRRSARQRLRTG